MKKSLFSDKIEPSCEICARGKPSNDNSKILCQKKGIVDSCFHCRAFKYDPLKRVPHHMPPLPTFDKDDFKL